MTQGAVNIYRRPDNRKHLIFVNQISYGTS